MPNSFYPAARKVFGHPMVKWGVGALFALVGTAITSGIYPFFKGWVATRASTEDVVEIQKVTTELEKKHDLDYGRLDSALSDDTSALTESEKLEWAILRIKRLEMKMVAETRARVGAEARLRMPRPNSEPAKRVAASVKAKFDDLVFKGVPTDEAAEKALEAVYGK